MNDHGAIYLNKRNTSAFGLRLGVTLLFSLVSSVSWGTCEFTAPEGWTPSKLRWDGPCKGGLAHGQGVLKDISKQPIERFFFGRFDKGQVMRGVIDQPDGFVAGDFRSGKVLASDDPQTTLNAFTEAKTAAKAVADKFRKAKSAASAKFYDDKAKSLAGQME